MKTLLSIMGAVGLGVTPAAVSTNLLSQQENIDHSELTFSPNGILKAEESMWAFSLTIDSKDMASEVFVVSWNQLGMKYEEFIKNYSKVKLNFQDCYLYFKYGSDDSSYIRQDLQSYTINLSSGFKPTSEKIKTQFLYEDFGPTSVGDTAGETYIYTQAAIDGLHFQVVAWVKAGGESYYWSQVISVVNIKSITFM
ncbi:hypothetical protein [Spiroplasma sp. DGKH1]|uniref:hypothetical protein n=1 Tax=Spiroplasma sp. DGKH1 TaxID=3050074 RepID=UPI0034C67E67